jgi:glycerol-3-phosphate dehydrogenase
MPAPEVSSDARPEQGQRFDALIVGGGALGCALAWEAASRGLHTALLERNDFGAETSANSLRIVHGGLRYLQKLDLRRARKSSRERAIMLRIAPHLVAPLECAVPTLSSWKRGRFAFSAGLALNRLVMAGYNRSLPATHRIGGGGLCTRHQLLLKAPGLHAKGVTGGARWFDAVMTSGERLALAFALSARARGATVRNHVAVERGLESNGRMHGVLARDCITGETTEMAARIVIDCTNAGESMKPRVFGNPELRGEFVKAVNIVIPDKGLGCAVGAPVRNTSGDPVAGRLIFAVPEQDHTVVGTWYFNDETMTERLPPCALEDILDTVNRAFPGWDLRADEILGMQTGFLPRGTDCTAEPLPTDQPKLIRAAAVGGPKGLWYARTEKWTTVRALAEQLIDSLDSAGELAAAPSRTAELALVGAELMTLTAEQSTVLSGLSAKQAVRISRHYGSRAGKLLDYVREDASLADAVAASPGIIMAEAAYAMEHEAVRTLDDLLRRLAPGVNRALAAGAVNALARFMQARRNWTEARLQAELQGVTPRLATEVVRADQGDDHL